MVDSVVEEKTTEHKSVRGSFINLSFTKDCASDVMIFACWTALPLLWRMPTNPKQ
jgi:hypothetical protein